MLINTWSSVTLLFFSNYPSKKKKEKRLTLLLGHFRSLDWIKEREKRSRSLQCYQLLRSTSVLHLQSCHFFKILPYCYIVSQNIIFWFFFFKSFIELFLKVFLIKNKPKLLTLVLMTGRNVVVYKNSHRNFFIKWMDCLDWSANDTLIIL